MLSKLLHLRPTGSAFLWLACVSTLLAQSSRAGALTGTVSDPSGAVVAGATVTLTNNDTGQVRMITTASDGTYRFALIPSGNYKVRFAATGFKVAEVPSVNHPQFGNPATTRNTPSTFGQITTTSTNPRLIQLALKYIFDERTTRGVFDAAGYALTFSKIPGRSGGAAPFNSLSFS